MNNTTLTAGTWFQIGTGLSVAMIEALGDGVQVYIGGSAPIAGAAGFTLPSAVPVNIPNIVALGGGIWVLASYPNCAVRYASA